MRMARKGDFAMRFADVIEHFNNTSITTSYKGSRFENLIARWFVTDPYYSTLVSKVWTWMQFPGRKDAGQSGVDVGIDLVIKTDKGEYWAIQCKCYSKDTSVTLPMVTNFIAAGVTEFYDENDLSKVCKFSRLIFINTGRMSSNVADAFKGKPFEYTFINSYQLEQSAVDWQKLLDNQQGADARVDKKSPMLHQIRVVEKAREYYIDHNHDRGKLIMACGTGKTFTSLKMVEDQLNNKGLVLFLVPSISLLGQSLNAWFADSEKPLKAVCVCSDASASKSTKKDEDDTFESSSDLALPASTNAQTIAAQLLSYRNHDGLVVVFSTYQSIDAVGEAQKKLLHATNNEYGVFDFIICDEAHRTSSAQALQKIQLKGISDFVKVHEDKYVKGKKRLYMTATPRIYDASVKVRANDKDMILYSMDDAEIYGEEIHKVNFAYAVENNLLTDYKVFIIEVNEEEVGSGAKGILHDKDKELDVSSVARMIGILRGLSKQMVDVDKKTTWEVDPRLMKRAMIFCSRIGKNEDEADTSKYIAHYLPYVSRLYNESLSEKERGGMVQVEARHVDGSMSSVDRASSIEWLREDTDGNECRVISNVRCLSEGVDVPALDSVVFLRPMNSQIDVVQSIGRVMRTFAKGTTDEKKYGYIIIPVVVPMGADPVKVMDDNARYQHVWQILQALRAHDDNFAAMISTLPQAKIHLTPPKMGGSRDGGNGGQGDNEGDDPVLT